MKFTKRPVTIEAVLWNGSNTSEIEAFTGEHHFWFNGADENPPKLGIRTLEGKLLAAVGDWIIKGVKGEFYPCKPDIFAATYVAAKEDPHAHLPPHQQRVMQELAELEDKRGKLEAFLDNPIFKGLPEDEKERLVRQLSCMGEYSGILRERIAAFPKADGLKM